MGQLNSEQILIALCSLVILSYVFSIIGRYFRVPSVLLLLFVGILFRFIADQYSVELNFSPKLVETLGEVGIIMIVLEAGLDLRLGRDKVKLIRNSFFSAFVIMALSTMAVASILYFSLNEPMHQSIVYAIPLSVMSSSIVLPSLHPLTEQKKEFLVYEASFSDILGILAFNYFIAENTLTWTSAATLGISLVLSILLSLALSFVLFIILAKTKMDIKFFLIFALLVLIYSGGRMLQLPSLLIILVFGLLINNWDKVLVDKLQRYFPNGEVDKIRHLLHSITAESSFLIRTFFFVLFGFSISLSFLGEESVIILGSIIVVVLFLVRLLYLKFFVHTNVFPESYFIPRGLVTIVLFYKIPEHLKLRSINDGLLFFVIVATGVIMTLAMIFYKKKPEQIVEEEQFAERNQEV